MNIFSIGDKLLLAFIWIQGNYIFDWDNSCILKSVDLFAVLTLVSFPGQSARSFGLLQEYNERRNKKLTNNLLTTDRAMYWMTSSRPSNFGDPLDAKTKVDNWFDENR